MWECETKRWYCKFCLHHFYNFLYLDRIDGELAGRGRGNGIGEFHKSGLELGSPEAQQSRVSRHCQLLAPTNVIVINNTQGTL